MQNIKYILLISIIALIVSCGNDKDNISKDNPKQYFLESNKASLEVEDASFTASYVFRSRQDVQTASIDLQVMRDNNSKLGFIVKFDTGEGIGLYDGVTYSYLDTLEKKYYVSGDGIEPDMFISQNWIMGAIQMIILDDDYSEQIISRNDEMSVITRDATLNTMKATVVEAKLPKKEDEKVDTKIQTYFDNDTKLAVKETRTRTQSEESVSISLEISNLKVNSGLKKSDFTVDVPAYYAHETITPSSEPESKVENTQAPDFTLKDFDNNVVTLSKLKGNVVVLDFWGTWCPWCVKSMPKLEKVHKHFAGKKVIVLGVSSNEPADADPKTFMQEQNVTYNSLKYGEDITRLYNVTGFPTLFVIDKNGKFLKTMSGYSDDMDTQLIEIIEKNL